MTSEKECPTCVGKEVPWAFSKYCEKHDVCVDCNISRKDIKDTPWVVRIGSFQCKPCEAKERQDRIDTRIEKGIEHEYTHEAVCPHCGYEFSDSYELGEGDVDCQECDEKFTLERNVTVDYTTHPHNSVSKEEG